MGWIRRTYENQVHLQQRYLDRNDTGGRDAVRTGRQLRWSGATLVGDLLPPAVSGPAGRPE
jgi:hypothetical protein